VVATRSVTLPPKLYFRIGEVAELVGVQPHVLRYWEREFRTIRPTKSAKGQRVYSRRDVENLMRVRDLLYRERFTIAGARQRLGRAEPCTDEADAAATAALNAQAMVTGDRTDPRACATAAEAADADEKKAASVGDDRLAVRAAGVRDDLLAMRADIQAFLAELDPRAER